MASNACQKMVEQTDYCKDGESYHDGGERTMKRMTSFFLCALMILFLFPIMTVTVPTVAVADAASDRIDLASQILANGNITLSGGNKSEYYQGKKDGANAKQNIKDTAAGNKAKLSSYADTDNGLNTPAPGGEVDLSVDMLRAMLDLEEKFGKYRISAIAGSCHSENSPHYKGKAFDVDSFKGGISSSKGKEIYNYLTQKGYKIAKVKGKENVYENQYHYHIQVNGYEPPADEIYTLDINGLLDNTPEGWTSSYATFDLYINGVKEASNITDFYQSVSKGSTYEIKNIRPVDGKEFIGYSSFAADGYVSGGRTGTVNANTDVRLTLNTVDAAAYISRTEPTVMAEYNGHSYFYYTEPVTWYAAKLISEDLGGHLVTITSEEENTFLYNIIGSSYSAWIGATDKDQENSFRWITGEEFSYAPWDDDQPDNWSGPEGAENFVVIWYESNGHWNDATGCDKLYFFCEFDHVLNILNLPTSLVSIESEAFSGVGAEWVVVPDSCESIAKDAFSECQNLKVVSVPASCALADGAVPSDVVILSR